MDYYTAATLGSAEAKGELAFYYHFGLYPNANRLRKLLDGKYSFLKEISSIEKDLIKGESYDLSQFQ